MSKITMSKSDLENLIGHVQTILDFVDTESMEEENVEQARVETENKIGIMERDRYEAMYSQINKMMQDYNDLSDEFREFRKQAAEQERKFIRKAQDRYSQLAELKAEIKQLKKYIYTREEQNT